MLTKLRQGLRRRGLSWLGGVSADQTVVIELPSNRSMPGQKAEAARFLYAFGPDAEKYLIQYALDVWVYTAVSELAGDFASAPLEVWHRNKPEKAENHGILGLLGAAGKPNEDQDRFEFLERHISDLMLTGNSYWYWFAPGGGMPDQVYILPPQAMLVVPGSSEVVGHYVMRWQGEEIRLPKENVTHFRKYHPLSRYYGLGAMEALRLEIQSDRSMAQWNNQFFGDDVFSPAGILVVDESVSDRERARLEDELEGKHGTRRRTAVVKSKPGSTVWLEAGLKHRDLDFTAGRLLSRQAVYEALGLPLGLWSESSTEAHARVAERLKLATVYKWHVRTATKLDQDVLSFWPGPTRYETRFADVRVRDWQMEAMKLKAVQPYMTVNEIREKHLNLPAIEGGDDLPGLGVPPAMTPNGTPGDSVDQGGGDDEER